MSTASTGASPTSGRRPRRRGTRCRRRRRSPGRTAAAPAGSRRRRTSGRATPAPAQAARPPTRPSAPLLPLPAITSTRAAVGAAEHPQGAARATAAPARSISTSTGSGAAASMARHLLRRDDRDHAIATRSIPTRRRRTAIATRPVVAQRQVPARRRHARRPAPQPRPVTTSHGAPARRARSTHTSWKPNAPRPSPSAFITASRAANRAASDGTGSAFGRDVGELGRREQPLAHRRRAATASAEALDRRPTSTPIPIIGRRPDRSSRPPVVGDVADRLDQQVGDRQLGEAGRRRKAPSVSVTQSTRRS